MFRRIAILLLAASLFAACSRAPRPTASRELSSEVRSSMQDLMIKVPAQSTQETAHVCDAILELGPDGVRHLCDALVPPGTIIDVPADQADTFTAPEGKKVNVLPGLSADTQARYLLGSLARHVTQPGFCKHKRLVFTHPVMNAIETAEDDEVRAFLIRRLQYSACNEAVPLLGELLADDRLCGPATQALEAIGSDDAADALLDAFDDARGESRIAIMKSLGVLQVRAAGRKIAPYAKTADPTTRRTALAALANIGCCRYADILKEASLSDYPYERSRAMDSYLLLMERLVEGPCPIGRRVGRKHIEDFIAERTAYRDAHARGKALAVLVQAKGDDAFPCVLSAADWPNKSYRMSALRLAPEFEGEVYTWAWMDKLNTAWPEARVEILHMLGQRGDMSAFGGVTQAIEDPDPAVSAEAMSAAVELAGAEALPFLVDALDTSDEGRIAAARAAIMRLPSDPAMASLAEALDGLTPAGRIAALGILGARRATGQSGAVFAQAEIETGKSDDPETIAEIRLAAVQALETVATPGEVARLVGVLVAAEADSEIESAAQKSIIAAANDAQTPEEGAGPVVVATVEAQGAKKAVLIRTLGKIGGEVALNTVLDARRTEDEDVRYAAAKAFSEWPQAEAAKPLLDLVSDVEDDLNRVLILQGAIRLVGEGKFADEERVTMYKQAAGYATRDEEKRAMLAGLSQVRTQEALELAARYVDDTDLADAAVQAVVAIALPPREGARGLEGDEVVRVLKQARSATEDERIQQRIDQHLDSLEQ